jgi:hypothetical protein
MSAAPVTSVVSVGARLWVRPHLGRAGRSVAALAWGSDLDEVAVLP